MQVYTNSNRHRLKIILLFIAVLFVAYLPVSTFLFSLKNDAFTGYFPPKFFMSESIHAGYLPLWNPYINYGIPQYGDMSSGFWSPLTWIIAGTVGYNAYTFTLEVLAYLVIGGLGMYKLAGYFNLQAKTRIIAATAFMCCGYNVGHMQHFNWLSGAAFLPWCVWGYLRLQQNFSVKNILWCALLLYLLISSAHPGISIGAFYFLLALSVFTFVKNEKQLALAKRAKIFFASHFMLVIVLGILSAGMIVGYFDILPEFSRGSKVAIDEALGNPTTYKSWLSLLMPFSITQNDPLFATDISMRNTYIGLAPAIMLLVSVFQKKNQWQKFLLGTGLAFLFLSAGGIFKIFAYKFIPLIGFVRLDGEFRIFSLLCFILVATMHLDAFLLNRKVFKGPIQGIYYSLEIIIGICIIIGLYKSLNEHQSFLYHLNTIEGNGIIQKLKFLIDTITFYDTLWIQGIMQMLVLWRIKWCLKKQHYNFLLRICIADLILATLLNLPFTGVGKASVAEVQSIINLSPKGIPVPALQPIHHNDTLNAKQAKLVGDWSFYNKQPGVSAMAPYPIVLKNTAKYFDSIQKDSSLVMLNKNFLFTTGSAQNSDSIHLISFSPGKIKLAVTVAGPGSVVYQQNRYPHWFYNDGSGKKEVIPYGLSFFYAPLKNGENQIEFSFEPGYVKGAMLITLFSFVALVAMLIFITLRPGIKQK